MDNIDQPEERADDMPRDSSSIEILSEGGTSEWSICSAGRSSSAGSDVGQIDFQKMSINSKMATIVHHDGKQFIERRYLDDGGLPYSAEFNWEGDLWKLDGEDCLIVSSGRYVAKVRMEGNVELGEDFDEALWMLLGHLNVVKVLLDEQLDECDKAKSVLEAIVNKLRNVPEGNVDQQRDVILLYLSVNKMDCATPDLKICSRCSAELLFALESYVTKIQKINVRDLTLGQLRDFSLSFEFIKDATQDALNAHRARLAAICPSDLKHKLEELPDQYMFCVTTDDMNLFCDLTTLYQRKFESVLPMIFSKFLTKTQAINDEQLADLQPLSNSIFLYVCKSLQDVDEKLGAHTKTENAIIYSEEHGWTVTSLQEESQVPYIKCLKQQLQLLARLANHFEPCGPFRTSRFPYEFKLFQNMDAVPEPVRIWLCLLDDCMKDLVQADIDKMQMLSCFFKSYLSFFTAEDVNGETLEYLRTITHDALRSMTGMQFQHEQTTLESVLPKCDDMISRCLDKFPRQCFGNACCQIESTLRRVVDHGMSNAFVDAFEQLLTDLSDLPLEWFVQLPPSEKRDLLLQGQYVVPVDNIWKGTEYQCFKVVDDEAFVVTYKGVYSCDEIPKHYQLGAIQVLLDKLDAKLIMNEGNPIDMINSIRNSILCLDEQIEYSCFEMFLQKMDESFIPAIEETRCLEECRNPMSPTMESEATDLPDTDPIQSEETLDALPELFEGSISKELLTNCLRLYTRQFNKHITGTAQMPREKRIEQIVSDVLLIVKPQLATSWTEEFKRNELPTVLAGLGAVWSLIVSKNGSSLDKLVKPTNLQICYILSIFGDRESDLYKLLYISTQQGRELVVGLTAALLALYGHKVLIACYNSNLARRNSVELCAVFQSFSIHSNISFGSMEDMARERSREVYDKFAAYTHECLGLELPANNDSQLDPASYNERSVLLINDIDLVLQSETLGGVFERFVRPTIPGLGDVQERLCNVGTDLSMQSLNAFIMSSNDLEMIQLRAFLARPESYKVFEGKEFLAKEYVNKSLFNKYLQRDLYSRSGGGANQNLRLSSNGVLVVKNYEHDQEASGFKYLQMKGSNFQETVNGYKNYGYFTLGCIPFPYATLLKSYPLVLGFATAPLDGYEEITLRDHYNLHRKIAKQNPLPVIGTKFDSTKDFLCVDSEYEWDWMLSIMVAINAAMEKDCSVLVFFENGLEMEEFLRKFALHLDHLSVTAIETASNGENYSESEIAVDEVTAVSIERNGEPAEDRQVHVIQTFWSSDSKEEELIRRQAERSHGSGSYELIVFRKDLSIPKANKKDTISYHLLETLREPRAYGMAMNLLTYCTENYEGIRKIIERL